MFQVSKKKKDKNDGDDISPIGDNNIEYRYYVSFKLVSLIWVIFGLSIFETVSFPLFSPQDLAVQFFTTNLIFKTLNYYYTGSYKNIFTAMQQALQFVLNNIMLIYI